MIYFYFTLCKYHHYCDYVDYTRICDNFTMLFKKNVAPAMRQSKKKMFENLISLEMIRDYKCEY